MACLHAASAYSPQGCHHGDKEKFAFGGFQAMEKCESLISRYLSRIQVSYLLRLVLLTSVAITDPIPDRPKREPIIAPAALFTLMAIAAPTMRHNADNTLPEMIPRRLSLESALTCIFSRLCRCSCSFSANLNILSAAPGRTASYCEKDYGSGRGPRYTEALT